MACRHDLRGCAAQGRNTACLEIPPPEAGGNTYFANMLAAYESLPADLKKTVEGKIAVHDASRNSAGMLRKGYKEVTDVRETVGAHHPMVRTDPKTGRKALFLARRPKAYVLGLSVAESEALLDTLWQHATQPRFAMCHTWQLGDLLMSANGTKRTSQCAQQCPLLGVKRTSTNAKPMSAFDPKRKSSTPFCCDAQNRRVR